MSESILNVLRDEHRALSAVLVSMQMLVRQGHGDAPERFFDVMRAMLFYIDEFPERLHHPSESNALFPRLARARPDLMPVIERLEKDHVGGEAKVRALQHLLLAWELLGDHRRPAFEQALGEYAAFYREHMRVEESEILPAAQQSLPASDWDALACEIQARRDPLASGTQDGTYSRLFTRIVLSAPAPVGVGKPVDPAVPA